MRKSDHKSSQEAAVHEGSGESVTPCAENDVPDQFNGQLGQGHFVPVQRWQHAIWFADIAG
jgi:hypothetical protein